jgi:Tol biopolymer transport system component
MKHFVAAAFVAMAAVSVGLAQQTPGAPPYLGQPFPDTTPRIFAPGVVSTGNIHSGLAIAPDGREMFWNTVDMKTFTTRLMHVRAVGDTWTQPQPPAFAEGKSAQSPRYSPDGKRLCYGLRTDQGGVTMFVESIAAGWSAPHDGAKQDCRVSLASSGRAYFSTTMTSKAWNSGIFSGRLSGGELTEIVPLGPEINVPNAIDYTPWVSPDESFLLFSSNRPATGDKEDMHVYVSFRTPAGQWSAPRRVSDIEGRFPSISPDGRFLFFCGDDGNIYWTDARILDALRPSGGSYSPMSRRLK